MVTMSTPTARRSASAPSTSSFMVNYRVDDLAGLLAALRKAELVACHKDGALRCYYLLRPTLVREMMPILRRNHPVVPRDRESVQREARGETT